MSSQVYSVNILKANGKTFSQEFELKFFRVSFDERWNNSKDEAQFSVDWLRILTKNWEKKWSLQSVKKESMENFDFVRFALNEINRQMQDIHWSFRTTPTFGGEKAKEGRVCVDK